MEALGFVTFGGLPLDNLTFRFPAMARELPECQEWYSDYASKFEVNGCFDADFGKNYTSIFTAS